MLEEIRECQINNSGYGGLGVDDPGTSVTNARVCTFDANAANVYVNNMAGILNLWNCRITAGTAGLSLTAGGTTNNLKECYIGQSGGNGIDLQVNATAYINSYTEVDSPTTDGIKPTSGSTVAAFQGTDATVRLLGYGGWGFRATSGGHGEGIQSFTYGGGGSGTFTPTTALAGSSN